MTSATAPRSAGWYHGWNIAALGALLAITANALPFSCLSLFLKGWSAEFHVPISQLLGATLPMMIFISLIGAFFIGPLADKKPARMILGLGVAGLAAFSLGIALAQKAWQIQLLFALVLPLPMTAATLVVVNPLVSRWFVKRLGVALGVTGFGMSVGGIVLPLIVAVELDRIGWRAIWLIYAAFTALIVLPAVLLIVRDRPTERDGLHYLSADSAPVSRPPGHGAPGASGGGNLKIGEVLGSIKFWRMALIALPLGCMIVTGSQNIVPLAVSHGLSQTMGGVLLSLFHLSQVIASLLVGVLADRFGARAPLVLAGLAGAAGGVLCALGPSMPVLSAAVLLMGLAIGVFTLVPLIAAADFGAENVGRVYGLFTVTMPLMTFASVGIAASKEITGNYMLGLSVLSVFCLLSVAIALFTGARRGEPAGPTEGQPAANLAE